MKRRCLSGWFRWPMLLAWCALALLFPGRLAAALQFDVFVGYDGIVREANWFPVVCEVYNDGPSFNAVFELTSDSGARSQVREIAFELPTNTRKRFVIPVFGAGRYSGWTARLIDGGGRVRATSQNLRAKKDISYQTKLLGALPRTFGGLPTLPQAANSRSEHQPESARLQAEQFPDTPLGLEGLSAIYLNSEKALELKEPQANALRLWLHNGGHLIVGIEQPADINGTPWLRNLLPCDVAGVGTVTDKPALQTFVQRGPTVPDEPGLRARTQKGKGPQSYSELAPESSFEGAEMPIAMLTPRSDGRTSVSAGSQPLIIEAARDRGKITVLAFSPEREPFRSWRNRTWFWARLLDVPPSVFNAQQGYNYGATSIDGVFGSMLDSTQVRKLPVTWLLLLLLVYLIVIGPLDQYILKKMNRQMLTWITFPSYVVLFSLLIYWIGFMLRAGETEWNELHVVDLLPRGERMDMRGHTYGSVYSPSNARYHFASDQPFATLRGEFLGSWNGGGGESSRSFVHHRGDGYEADVSVPVWVSELVVSDWWQPADAPLKASLARRAGKYQLTVDNLLSRKLAYVRVAVDNRIIDVLDLQAHEHRVVELDPARGRGLAEFVREHGGNFQQAANNRRQSFGDDEHLRLRDSPNGASAVTFVGLLAEGNVNPANYFPNQFILPDGVDLTRVVERGDAVLLAWDAGNAPIKPLNRFDPRRSRRDTLYRLAMQVTE